MKVNSLVLSGGAPTLNVMMGILSYFDKIGLDFNHISATGAGCVAGLSYFSPKDNDRQKALRFYTDILTIQDDLYKIFPGGWKTFYKSGKIAEQAIKFMLPILSSMSTKTEKSKYIRDIYWLYLVSSLPWDLTQSSKGFCQPPPFMNLMTNFDELKNKSGEFYISAYEVESEKTVTFEKDIIDLAHFNAALSMPLIYSPTVINNKTYMEGSAFDAFRPEVFENRNDIKNIVAIDIISQSQLIHVPTSLLDAWSVSILAPLTRMTHNEVVQYQNLKNNKKYKDKNFLVVEWADLMTKEQWQNILSNSSYSFVNSLFELGEKAAERFVNINDKILFNASL